MADILSLTLVQNAWKTLFPSRQFSLSIQDPSVTTDENEENDAKKANVKKVNQRLDTLSILDMSITGTYVYPMQPTENGLVNKDTRIRMPITASATIALPTANGDDYSGALSNLTEKVVSDKASSTAYEKVFNAIENAIKQNYKWTILTKNKVYKNMFLQEMPTSITPENMNRPVYTLNFSENLFEEEEKEEVKEAKDKDKSLITKLAESVEEKYNNAVNTIKDNLSMLKDKFSGLFTENTAGGQ